MTVREERRLGRQEVLRKVVGDENSLGSWNKEVWFWALLVAVRRSSGTDVRRVTASRLREVVGCMVIADRPRGEDRGSSFVAMELVALGDQRILRDFGREHRRSVLVPMLLLLQVGLWHRLLAAESFLGAE